MTEDNTNKFSQLYQKYIQSVLDTYAKGKKYDGLKEDYEDAKEQREEYRKKLRKVEDKVNTLDKELQEAREAISDFKDTKELPSPNELKSHYMYKYEQNNWDYPIKGGSDKNVSLVFRYKNKEVVREFARKTIDRHNLDEKTTAQNALSTLYEDTIKHWNWDYETDQEHFDKREYWQAADKSLKDMTGDCDDRAIALYCVAELMFEMLGKEDHFWRLRFTTARTLAGGHAFCVWLADDLQWYVVESTMDARGSFQREWLSIPIKNDNFYKEFYGFATKNRTWRGDTDALNPHEDADVDYNYKNNR